MPFVTFVHKGEPRVGIVRGDEIHPLPAGVGTMLDYIELSRRERQNSSRRRQFHSRGRTCSLRFARARTFSPSGATTRATPKRLRGRAGSS